MNRDSARDESDEAGSGPTPNSQRDRIRLAAVQLFAQYGFAGTSMKQLARALNTAPGNIYNYYPNKEAILFDVLEYQLLGVIERNLAIIEEPVPPHRKLEKLARDLVTTDLNDPSAAFVGIQGLKGLSEENAKYISDLMGRIRSIWADVITEGIDAGDFKVGDQKLISLSLLTLCSSVATWFRHEGEYTVEYVAGQIAESALRIAGFAQA